MFITLLRRNVGVLVAALGFVLLCIMTFGDLGELASEEYWYNVRQNITSIGFMSVSLTLVQTSIRQGLAEQALQRGLNTERTQEKYVEHRELIKSVTEKMIYLPYFLQAYNERHTRFAKHEFLVSNNFASEATLRQSGSRRLNHLYNKIIVHLTPSCIKWTTTDIVYNKKGQIVSMQGHRRRRVMNAVLTSLAFMLGVTFITRGLFFTPSDEPIGHKFVRLFSYIVAIAISSILAMIKEYEKGAFGVPNELDEINAVWFEFKGWIVPEWVVTEVTKFDEEVKENEQRKCTDHGAALPGKQTES